MPQIIPLVVTAITTVTSAVVAAGPLAVAAFNTVNVLGAGLLANAAFQAIQPEVKSSGTAIEWNADPNAPNRFAFGRVGGAGNIIHNRTYGPNKMYVGFVCVLSASGPIKGFVGFKADDTPVSFNGSGMAVSSEYANEMWIDRLRGLQPETRALASPSGLKSGATIPAWGSGYKLSGKAAFMYTLGENSKRSAYQGKVPTPINTFEGLYCYDPRYDSTYPGGSGPCRLNDPTTWIYSINGPIQGLNWNIGRWEGLTAGAAGAPYASMKVGGIGARPEGIDFAGYVEAANVFDENQWVSAAWPDADQSKAAVLDSFLQASGAIYAERQGKISCMHRAAPRTSIVTITADDTAGTIEYDTTTSLLERINTIRPKYWSEAHGWQMVETLQEVTSSVWREEDGQGVAITKSKGLDYNYVPGSKQVRELAALQISHTREGIKGTAPLRHYLDLEVGDCFTWDVPEAVLNGLKCIVLNVDPDLEGDIINVTFCSESDGKYPFAFGQAASPSPAPEIIPRDLTFVSPPLPGDWTITPRPPVPGGGQLPGLDLGGIVSNDTATAIIVEYGPTDEGPWTQVYQGPPTVTNIPIDGLQPGETYFIAVQYQREQNYSERHVYGPYSAPDLIAGDTVNIGGQPVAEFKTGITDAFDDYNLALGQIDDRVEAVELDIDDPATGLKVRVGSVELMSGNTASRVGVVETSINTPVTGILARTAAVEVVSADLALSKADASRVTLVEANANRATAINPNPNFSQNNFANGVAPPGWFAVTNGALLSRVAGKIGANALRMSAPAGTEIRIGADSPTNFTAPVGGGWYVLEVAVELTSGGWRHCEVDLTVSTAGFVTVRKAINLGLGVTADDDGVLSQNGTVGKLTRFTVLFELADGAATDRWVFAPRNGLVRYFPGPSAACTLDWHRIATRRATASEIELRQARGSAASVGARVGTVETSTDELFVRTRARWAQGTSVPGAATFIYAQSEVVPGDPPSSEVGIGAGLFAISNPTETGGWRTALKTENGDTTFYGGVTAANFVRMNNGAIWYFAYRSQIFQLADGASFTFPNFGVAPQYEFLRDNLLPLGTGESYDLRLKSLTAGSAVVWAKINVPGAPSAQSNGPTTTAQPSGPKLQLGVTASSKPESVDGYYTVSGTVTGSLRVFGGSEDEEITVSGSVTVWAMKSGVWYSMATIAWSHTDTYSNPGGTPINVPVTASFSGTVQLGDGVASIGGGFGGASGITAGAIASMSTAWSAAGTASGTRSALASGAKASIRIIPQG